MTKSVLFFTVSFLLLLLAALTNASPRNTTSGLRYDGCTPGDTVGKCITATVEEEEEEEAVVRWFSEQKNQIGYGALQKQPAYKCKIAGKCIGRGNKDTAGCTYYGRCKRSPSNKPF